MTNPSIEDSSIAPSTGSAGPATGTRMSADEIYHNVRRTAEEELDRPGLALFWSALAAGLIISFSFLGAAYLRDLVPEHLKAAALAAGYPLGFILVVLARNQLFTENTLEPIIPFLHQPGWPILRRLLVLWAIVLCGNLLGTLSLAGLLAYTPLVAPAFKQTLLEVAAESTSGGFGLVLYWAIFGGWLIALMAWLIASTHETIAQILLIWLTTAPIAAFGFRHSIAGSVEAFYQAMMGATTWGASIGAFVVPAVIGNIIGGVVLVALLNHGQVTAGAKTRRNEQPEVLS